MSPRGSASSISSTRNSKAKICLQLGHSGGKGSTRLGWEGNDVPLDDGNWPVIAASDVPLVAGQPGADADDPRRHGHGPRPVRRRGADGARMRLRHGRAARRARLSARPASSPRCRTGAPTNMAAASKTACAIRSKSSRRCARPGRGQADVGAHLGDRLGRRRRRSRRTMRWRSARPSRARART